MHAGSKNSKGTNLTGEWVSFGENKKSKGWDIRSQGMSQSKTPQLLRSSHEPLQRPNVCYCQQAGLIEL
jgi:hypothetical protein